MTQKGRQWGRGYGGRGTAAKRRWQRSNPYRHHSRQRDRRHRKALRVQHTDVRLRL